jgi:hypothetical protein
MVAHDDLPTIDSITSQKERKSIGCVIIAGSRWLLRPGLTPSLPRIGTFALLHAMRWLTTWLTTADSAMLLLIGSPLRSRAPYTLKLSSPLLSNIYMRRFVLGWKQLGYAELYKAHIVNYADDPGSSTAPRTRCRWAHRAVDVRYRRQESDSASRRTWPRSRIED